MSVDTKSGKSIEVGALLHLPHARPIPRFRNTGESLRLFKLIDPLSIPFAIIRTYNYYSIGWEDIVWRMYTSDSGIHKKWGTRDAVFQRIALHQTTFTDVVPANTTAVLLLARVV